MITEHDLREAIAECEGQRNPTANTCIKLAAFYTIKQHMFPDDETPVLPQTSSAPRFEPAEYSNDYVHINSGSDFASAVEGLPTDLILDVFDELMETLSVLNPKLYNSIMRKIKAAE